MITAGNRGEDVPAQIERAGRLGDGVITTYCIEDDCLRLREVCADAFEQHGRSRPGFPICVSTTVRIEDDAATAEAQTRAFLDR